jgi:RimJ/RimL family protein N-acetyltransferase
MSKYFWETERIRLRGVEPEDWEVHYHWDMDSEMQRNTDILHFPTSETRTKRWAEEASKKTAENDNFHMEIILLETEQVIGSISSSRADSRNGTFRYGIAIHPEFQCKGYATEAILLLLKFFFEELRYQKCTVIINDWNDGSVALHEKLGFVKEGQLRRMIYRQGQYWDMLYYGMTIEEWRERFA